MRSPSQVWFRTKEHATITGYCGLSSHHLFAHDAQEQSRCSTKAAAGGWIATFCVKQVQVRKCPQYLSDCLRNMEQNKLGRRSDAEVLNLVLGDLPAISDYFINLDLGILLSFAAEDRQIVLARWRAQESGRARRWLWELWSTPWRFGGEPSNMGDS